MSRVIGFLRRIASSLRVVALGTLVSAVIFTTLRTLEIKNAQAAFDGVAQERLDALETNVTLALNNLICVGAYYAAPSRSWPCRRQSVHRSFVIAVRDDATPDSVANRRGADWAKLNREAILNGVAGAVEQKKANGSRVTVSDAIEVFLEDVKAGKSVKTYQARQRMMNLFTESCSKQYLDQITEADLQQFIRFLRKRYDSAKGKRTACQPECASLPTFSHCCFLPSNHVT